MGEPLYHAIGDSHTRIFEGQYPFITHTLGPATAYGLNNENSRTGSRKKLASVIRKIDRSRDFIILSFGEIDCRFHVLNLYEKSGGEKSPEEIIDKSIGNYLKVVGQFDLRDGRLMLLSIPPAGRQDNIYKYPFYGTQKKRAIITKMFNEQLAQACKEREIRFIDLYSKVCGDDGIIPMQYEEDETHLNNKVVPFVREILALNRKKMET